jgi:HSP20 family protein
MATTTPVKPREKALAPVGRTFPFLLSRMRDEFDEMFERMSRLWDGWKTSAGPGWRWGLDVKEQDDAIVVRAEAPGFAPEEIDVQVAEDRLVIQAKKKEEKKGEGTEEWSEKECYESITLPAAINKDKVEARYQNGVLTITLPRTEQAKTRKVAVKNV